MLTSYQGDGQTNQPTSVPSPILTHTGESTHPNQQQQQQQRRRWSNHSLVPVDCDGRRESTASLYDNLLMGPKNNNSNAGTRSGNSSWQNSSNGGRQINSNIRVMAAGGGGENNSNGRSGGGGGDNNSNSGLFDSDFSSASDSPDEEWTHF